MSKNKSTVSKKKLLKAFKTIEKTGLSLSQKQLNQYQEKACLEHLNIIYQFYGISAPSRMKNLLLYAMECIIKYENKEHQDVNENNMLNMRMLYELFEKMEAYSDRYYLKALFIEVIHNRPARTNYEELQAQSKKPLFEDLIID